MLRRGLRFSHRTAAAGAVPSSIAVRGIAGGCAIAAAWAAFPSTGPALSQPCDDSCQERATGISFPASLGRWGTYRGSGCRYKFGIVKVYAVGLYSDSTANTLAKVLETPTCRAFRIVLNMSVSDKAFSDAIGAALTEAPG